MIPYDDPVLFKTTVGSATFVKKDRNKDLVKSMEALKASHQ